MAFYSKAIACWTLSSLLLVGCWDLKNPQDINYFTAVGFDYIDDKFIVYVQMLDFSSVAKTETESGNPSTPIWVGKAMGDTVSEALNNLYDTTQLQVFYGHINALIYSENILNKGLQSIFDLQNRFYEMRFTPWMFGTKFPIEEIMTKTSFFNLSPTLSILHQPLANYAQKSVIKPLTSREFITDFQEPGKTSILPSLGVDSKTWFTDGKGSPLLEIDAIYLFQNETYEGRLSKDKIPGLRWITPETNRSPLLVKSDGELYAALSLENPKVKIIPEVNEAGITFSIDVRLIGDIIEIVQPLPESTLEKNASELVRKEIEQTYKNGLEIGADLFQLEYTLYKKDIKEWKKMRENQDQLNLTSDSVNITVSVDLTSSGKLKMNQK